MLPPKSLKNRCQLRKAIFRKIVPSLQWGLDFLSLGGPSWEQKSIKNQSKKEFNIGRHLGIDFEAILMDFAGQLGGENRAKTGQDRARQGKTKEGKGREGRGKEERGRDWKGKKVAVDFLRPGGRGSPTL